MAAEPLKPEHVRVDDTGPPAAPSASVAWSPALRATLLDPALWRDSLHTYAKATHLAVALTDTHGNLLDKCLNPRPTWQLLQAQIAAVFPSGCPFSLASPHQPCPCITDALAKERVVMARDRTQAGALCRAAHP